MNTRAILGAIAILTFSFACVLFSVAALADGRPPHNRPPDNRPPDQRTEVDVDQSQRQHQGQLQGQQQGQTAHGGTATAEGGAGGSGGAGGDAQSSSGAEASAGAEASSSSAGGNVGDITIEGDAIPADTTHQADIELKNTPDIVNITPGSGDTCKAHIGANLSLPGLGTGLTIPLPGKECRKLKYYDRMVDQGDLNAAEIIFCGLKDIKAEFRELGLDCRETLSIFVPATGQVILTEGEYDNLMAEAVQKEEFEEAVEQAEYRYAQQQSLIEALQEEVSDHDVEAEEIERLKREAADLRREQEARKAAEEESKLKFKQRLSAKEEK